MQCTLSCENYCWIFSPEISPNCEYAMIAGAFSTAFQNTIIYRRKNARTIPNTNSRNGKQCQFFFLINIVIVSTFIERMIYIYFITVIFVDNAYVHHCLCSSSSIIEFLLFNLPACPSCDLSHIFCITL